MSGNITQAVAHLDQVPFGSGYISENGTILFSSALQAVRDSFLISGQNPVNVPLISLGINPESVYLFLMASASGDRPKISSTSRSVSNLTELIEEQTGNKNFQALAPFDISMTNPQIPWGAKNQASLFKVSFVPIDADVVAVEMMMYWDQASGQYQVVYFDESLTLQTRNTIQEYCQENQFLFSKAVVTPLLPSGRIQRLPVHGSFWRHLDQSVQTARDEYRRRWNQP